MKILLGLLSLLMFTGCVYPIYKTLQPESKVIVLNENKIAVKNVKIHLQSTECIPCKKSEEVHLSNNRGVAQFNARKEWRREIFIIHGSKFFTWGWCVEKEGYKTILTPERRGDKFESHRNFMLEKGKSLPCDSPYLLSEFKLKRFDDSRLKNAVRTLISEMLDPNKALNAYVKLEKLGKDAVPYIVLEMNDFRELPVKSILFAKRKVTVHQVTDVLSIILTKITGQGFSLNFDEKSLNEKVYNIYKWRHWIRNWGLSENI